MATWQSGPARPTPPSSGEADTQFHRSGHFPQSRTLPQSLYNEQKKKEKKRRKKEKRKRECLCQWLFTRMVVIPLLSTWCMRRPSHNILVISTRLGVTGESTTIFDSWVNASHFGPKAAMLIRKGSRKSVILSEKKNGSVLLDPLGSMNEISPETALGGCWKSSFTSRTWVVCVRYGKKKKKKKV